MAKVIVVTGASRGMGQTIVNILLESSTEDKVVLVARSKDKLQEYVDALSKSDQERVFYVAGDLTDPATLESLVTETIEKFGKINSVVFNAGVLEPIAHIDSVDTTQVRKLFEVNFFSIVDLTQKLIPELRKAAKEDGIPSSCVFVSSLASTTFIDGWLAYGASKAALNHLAMDLHNEEEHIRTISIDPGIVDTGMQVNIRNNLGTGMKKEAHKMFLDIHEQGKLLKPEVPGGVCALLALKGIPEEVSGQFVEYCDARLADFHYKY